MTASVDRDVDAPVDPPWHWWRWLRRGGLLLVTVVVVEYVVLPQLVTARDDASLLRSAHPWLLGIGLALEAGSLLSFSALSRASLPSAGRPPYLTLLRIDLSGLGLSHVVPGGGATAAAFRYRLLTRAGVAGRTALTATTISTAAALLALVAVFVTGVGVSGAALRPGYLVAGLLAAVLVIAVAVGVALLSHDRSATLRVVSRLGSRLPTRWLDGVRTGLDGLATRVVALQHDPGLLARTVLWALGNWVLDAACLWVCLRAYGYSPGPGPLLALYGAVGLLALVPTTPGGLGVVEGVLVPALVSLGATPSAALLGVITWRLAEYWLPIPVSLVTYLSLRFGALRPAPPGPSPAASGTGSGPWTLPGDDADEHRGVKSPSSSRP